jgi:colanic acid/amylovoran biosynthesis glycosyltransferase
MGEKLVEIGCHPERIQVHRLGVDLTRIPYRGDRTDEADPPVVLMYAAFREKKGHIYGLRAFSRICGDYPDARMDVVGDGPLRAEIEAEVRRLGLGERVTLKGILPHPVCLQELSKTSVLLYPSVTAADGDTEGGAPVAIIEAMAAGVPVVSSHHADIPEVATDGGCGILAEERDVEGLAEGLAALLGSRTLRGRMGQAGRVRAEENHSLATQTKRLEEIYDRILGS